MSHIINGHLSSFVYPAKAWICSASIPQTLTNHSIQHELRSCTLSQTFFKRKFHCSNIARGLSKVGVFFETTRRKLECKSQYKSSLLSPDHVRCQVRELDFVTIHIITFSPVHACLQGINKHLFKIYANERDFA